MVSGEGAACLLVCACTLLTGATSVMDFTRVGCLAAKARAMMQPMEWLTRWKEALPLIRPCGSMRLLSIASTWSLTLYMQFAGLGLRPKPRRSTANSRQSSRMKEC